MAESVWNLREQRILEAIAVADLEGVRPDSAWVVEQTGLDANVVGRGLEALVDADYVAGADVTSLGDDAAQFIELSLRRKGREAVGSWERTEGELNAAGGQRIVEVLIASPSDTAEQRDRVEQAIHEWNSLHAIERGVALLPRRWERDVHPVMGAAPQTIINRQVVDRCQILIGIFWTRLGTKTDDADSGTVEEIQRFLDAGKPTHLFFSDQPAAVGTIDTDQLSRLNDYKASLQREGLLGIFSTGEDLAKQVGFVLTNDVREGAALSPRAEPNKPDTPRLEITSQKSGSGFAVTVSNQGTSEATRVSVSLEGGLFMLNAAHERIGSGFKDSDEIGSLTPGSSRSYNVTTAAQTATPRVRVSCAESDAVEVELS